MAAWIGDELNRIGAADSYVPPMLSPDARATTLKLVPSEPGERPR